MALVKRWTWAIVVLLLGAQAAQFTYVVHRESLTFDEDNHMFSGYMMWKTGDYGLNPEHPPLVKLLATLPILGEKLWIPPLQHRQFKQEAYLDGRDWLAHNDGSSQRLVFRMRLMAGLLALGLSLVVFAAAREWFGLEAGLIALVLVTFDPNILAHSALVTTDMGVTFFFLASIYAFYRYVKKPTAGRLVIAGIVAGLLLATKHSGILLAPMLVLLILWEIFAAPRETRGRVALRLSGALAAMVVIGVVVLWAFYGFRFRARPAGLPFVTVAEYVKPLSRFSAAPVLFFDRFHLLPESYLIGLVDVKRMADFYSTFIFGKVYAHAVWWYFPVVITIKTTLALLALTAVAFFAIAMGKLRKGRELAFLLIPPAFYLFVAIVAGMNIGARHILPVYAFVFILAGAGLAAMIAGNRRWQWAGGALIAAHIVSALVVFPNYIAYANQAWGGPRNVHNLLTDANMDWAQQLYQVKDWVDRHPGEPCWFAYFAYPEVDPAVYGIHCQHLPTVDTGWIGGSDIIPPSVQGNVILSAGDMSGGEWPSDYENPVRAFKTMQPSEVIDYGVFVFRGSFDMKPSATLSRVQNAYHLLAQHQRTEALVLVREAVAIDPKDIRSQVALGNVAAALGQKDEARQAWMAALQLAGNLDPESRSGVVADLQEKLKKL